MTQKDNRTYVYDLAGEGEETLPEKVQVDFINKAANVRLLGSDAAIDYQCDAGALMIDVPEAFRASPPCRHGWVFEVTDAEIIA